MAIGIVKTINGVKQLVPLTTDSGQGLPLGAWTSFEDDQPRNGYLKAGTTFNASDYPALYNMLGNNVVPDKGYGMDWDNAQSITLSTTDYVVQKSGWIVGYYRYQSGIDCYITVNGVAISTSAGTSSWYSAGNIQVEVKKGDIVKCASIPTVQEFHYVPYLHPMFIKAVIGPIEDSAADQVVQNINNSRSYSTEEVNTGKKWIDGKPIYRKTYYSATNWSNGTVLDTISNLNMVVNIIDVTADSSGNYSVPHAGTNDIAFSQFDISTKKLYAQRYGIYVSSYPSHVTIEYTKTTD